jgi:hypothetical protein
LEELAASIFHPEVGSSKFVSKVEKYDAVL